ncbi:exodeoxyribonuclease V subunit alpha [Gordonia sp. 'Campus']|uniref:exodeoxyribonuclease V subunit alpha n=1 Tax=Gordonia sp. 'Campus' TaxID=2915824 RepID=UPI001EE3D52B|nr:exodeoxyribonuclease V subunit alpha [Gordonia sp. 'Campus']
MSISDDQRVQRASGVLADWNEAGVLAAADVHITERLVGMCAEPVSDTARLGAALAVRAVRLGSTCLALDRLDELAGDDTAHLTIPAPVVLLGELLESPLVAGSDAGPLRPLVVRDSVDGPLVYLQKYFRQEQMIRDTLARRALTAPTVDPDALRIAIATVYTSPEDGHLQKLAAAVAATRWTTVLAGGPGTGKTYTVARILAVLDALQGPGLRIGLCAPTGRAAAQLQASVEAESTQSGSDLPVTAHAVTLHSLLGWRPGANPRYGRGRTLPHDVIVVDETSMLSMTAMSRLLDAVRPDARVIFVGDPHQLASVEAGAVLADLVERTDVAGVQADPGTPAVSKAALDAVGTPDHELGPEEAGQLADGVITLRRQFRFGGGISRVAAAVNSGDADEVLRLVAAEDVPNVELVAPDDLDEIRADLVEWGRTLRAAARRGDASAALDALDAHRVLCAHREGTWGVRGWSARITDWLGTTAAEHAGWYAGQPILVTANDRQTSTFNGDTGVVIADPEGRSARGQGVGRDAVRVAFRRGGAVRLLHPTQLADVVSVHAMTIHRSQGSQFDQVTVVLPPTGSELLTRELLYTAITRAREHVRIVGTPEVLAAAVNRRVQRASGLRSTVMPFGGQGTPAT